MPGHEANAAATESAVHTNRLSADSALVQVCFSCHQLAHLNSKAIPDTPSSIPPLPSASASILYPLLQQLKNGKGSAETNLMARLLKGYTNAELQRIAKALATKHD